MKTVCEILLAIFVSLQKKHLNLWAYTCALMCLRQRVRRGFDRESQIRGRKRTGIVGAGITERHYEAVYEPEPEIGLSNMADQETREQGNTGTSEPNTGNTGAAT